MSGDTLRSLVSLRVAALEAALVTEKAKLETLPTALEALLDHPVDEVVAFIRTFGSHLFPKAVPKPAADLPPVVVAGVEVMRAPVAALPDGTAADTHVDGATTGPV